MPSALPEYVATTARRKRQRGSVACGALAASVRVSLANQALEHTGVSLQALLGKAVQCRPRCRSTWPPLRAGTDTGIESNVVHWLLFLGLHHLPFNLKKVEKNTGVSLWERRPRCRSTWPPQHVARTQVCCMCCTGPRVATCAAAGVFAAARTLSLL